MVLSYMFQIYIFLMVKWDDKGIYWFYFKKIVLYLREGEWSEG